MNTRLVAAVSIAGALSVLLAGCSAASGSTAGTSTAPSAVASSSPATAEEGSASSSFEDGTVSTSDLTIKVTKHKMIKVGAKGNEYGDKPVIAFYYEITNRSGDDVTPMNWIYLMRAYQDNNPDALNELEVASLPDDRFLETQTEKTKKGGTVKNAVAYELDDLTTPVDLVASDTLGQSEIGRASFSLK